MKLKRNLLIILTLVGLLGLFSCARTNDTVAPSAGPCENCGTTGVSAMQSTNIMNGMCSVFLRCNSQNTVAAFNNCTIQFSKAVGLGEALGLPAGKYGTYLEVIQAETSGAIVPDPVASKQCLSDIASLMCSLLPSSGFALPSTPGSCPNVF